MNDSKEHIIKVALKLFLQYNFKEVTMQDIMEKTGLSKGTLYYHFKSKEDLFIMAFSFYSSIKRNLYEEYSKDSFYKFYHDYANHIKESDHRFRQLVVDDNDNSDDFNINHFTLQFDILKVLPEFKGAIRIEQKNELDSWTMAIQRAKNNGEIYSSANERLIAQMFLCLNEGVSAYSILGGNKIDLVNSLLIYWDWLYEQLKTSLIQDNTYNLNENKTNSLNYKK